LSHEQINCLDALFLYSMVSQYQLHINVFQHLKFQYKEFFLVISRVTNPNFATFRVFKTSI